jgi:hypothetical protein
VPSDPIRNDVRKARHERRIGADGACVVCGESDRRRLITSHRSLLERHHLGGASNDPCLVVVVCRNCHAVLSEAQLDSGVDLGRAREHDPLEQLEGVLRGLADFFVLLAESLRRWADLVAASVQGHDDRKARGE